jgi:ligand-binding SRPBCC domain-containing protein
MKPHVYNQVTYINRPLSEVFEFFSKAENLNKLTPPILEFKIITPLPIKMEKGTFIDYKIKLNGISFKWKTQITAWENNRRFIDTQIKGPYKIWIHEHLFEEENGQVKMTDTVQYLSPGWFLEPIINKLYISKKVKEIFAYRTIELDKLFA